MRFPKLSAVMGLSVAFLLTAKALRADAFDSLAKDLARGGKRLERNKIAVLPFPYHDGRSTQGSNFIAERLVAALSENKKIEVLERVQLENMLREISFQRAGTIDQESARQIGRIIGVDGLVIGTLIDVDEDTVEINARLVATESGDVVASARQDIRRMWKEVQPKRTEETPPDPANAGEALNIPSAQDAASAKNAAESTADVEQVSPELEAAPQKPQRVQAPIVLDTRGQARLTEEDYRILESNFSAELNRAREASQLYDGFRVLRTGDASRALGIFALLERRYKKQPRMRALARLGTSLCEFEMGRKGAAISGANSVAGETDYPSISAAAHFALARYAEIFGRVKEARNHYLDILRISPFQNTVVKAASERYNQLKLRTDL